LHDFADWTMLMQDNKDRQMFARMASPKEPKLSRHS